jgi:hemerythrin-like domain-containing protein
VLDFDQGALSDPGRHSVGEEHIMRPTEILSGEHRVIEQVLDALDVLAARARESRALDRERAAAALEFLRLFADKCHHGKEEGLLFPMLNARGMPQHSGPIAVMLDDHRAGRECVIRMDAALALGDVDAFAHAAANFTALLREHIAREDGVLFPMAESILDESARRALGNAFQRFEHDDMGADTHQRLAAVADQLARHCGVPLASERGAPASSGCGHGCHQ